MSEIKYVVEVEDDGTEAVFDKIAEKAKEITDAYGTGNDKVVESVENIADAYDRVAKESKKTIDSATASAAALSDANSSLGTSLEHTVDEAKKAGDANAQLAASVAEVKTNAAGLGSELENVAKAQEDIATSAGAATTALEKATEAGKGLGDGVAKAGSDVVASVSKITEVEEKQRAILASVGKEYRETLGNALEAYQAMSPELQRLNNRLSDFEQESKDVAKAQEAINKSFNSGALTQKQYLEATKALKVQQSEISVRIRETKAAVDALDNAERKTIGSIAEKTARLTELKRRYEELSEAQRKNANVGGSISAEYNKVSAEITKANAGLSDTGKGVSGLLVSLKNMAGVVGIAFGVQQVVSFGLEIFDLAKKIEGVSLAFSKIGAEGGLERLREATRNTVDDFKLMQLAVNAKNFKIPLDTLASGLAFAGQRAKDTGQEIDYLVESFVTGLGRKSTMILDNLGLSIIEIQDEVKKVGDFNIAVGNIIDREMKKSGDAVDTLGEKTSRLATIWQNLKISIAQNTSAMFSSVDQGNIDAIIQKGTAAQKGFDKSSLEAREKIIALRQGEVKSIEDQVRSINKARAANEKNSRLTLNEQSLIDDQYEKQLKPLVEQLSASRTLLVNAQEQNKALVTQDRLRKGLVVSNVELEEEIAKKRAEANGWIVKDKSDQAYVNKLLKEADGLQAKLNERNGQAAKAAPKKSKGEGSKALKQDESDNDKRIALLEKWASADASYLNKQLSRDEQEVQSVRDKYDALRKEIERYNKDTKAKRIELATLAASEEAALTAVRNKQAYNLELENLEKQRSLWIEYEDLRTKIGEEKARERYAILLDFSKNYEQQLNDAISKLESKGTRTGQEDDQLQQLRDRLNKFSEEKRKKDNADYVTALEAAKSYNEKLLSIEQDYTDKVTALGDKATAERLAALKKTRDETVSALSMEGLVKAPEWTDVFVDIMDKTQEKAKDSIAILRSALEQMLKAGKITIEDYKRAIEGIKDVEIRIYSSGRGIDDLKAAIKLYKEANGMAKQDALSALGSVINEQIQKVAALGNEINGVFDQLGVGSEKFREDLGMSLDLLSTAGEVAAAAMSGDILGAVTGSVKLFSQAISMFGRDRGLERSIKSKQESVEKLQAAFEKLNYAINNSVGESFYADSQKQIDNLKQQQKLIADMMKAEQSKKKSDKAKVAQYQSEISKIDQQISDIGKTITETLVQTSFKALSDSLADALVTAFEQGESAIDAMNSTFDDFIKNAITNSLKLKLIEPIINDMINSISSYMKMNDNSLDGYASFGYWKDLIAKAGQQFTDTLESTYKNLGLDIGKATTVDTGLQGAIRREMTEATASELTGLYRANYDIAKQQFEFSKSQGNAYLTTMITQVRHLNAIQANTHNTVLRLDDAIEQLGVIAYNTMSLTERYA